MEATKKSKSKKSNLGSAQAIQLAYREYLLIEGMQPASVFKFCKENGMSEAEFYTHFASFEAIEKAIWQGFVVDTKKRLESDEAFGQFTSREKILTFYFSLAELLKADRSFVLHQLKSVKASLSTPLFLKGFKSSFEEWINGILNQGIGTGEIAKRPYLDERYATLFWMHLLFILQFWSKDESLNFEQTDAAIEKSVTLAFDLIGKGVLDNALDFGKFLYHNAKQ
jgi:AcrR family transcriptional regulator